LKRLVKSLATKLDRSAVKREKARRHLCDFLEYDSGYSSEKGRYNWNRAQHLEMLAEKLEQIEKGNLRKLMVFMPPRHGKSEMVSKKFPAWYLGRNPNNEIILSSYTADLAYDFSEIARNTVRRCGGDVFGKELSSQASAKKKWKLAEYGGSLAAAGVGGPITGRGADVAIIDDPFKNWEEASSKTIRDKVDKWYQSVLRTRLNPKGSIVLVMTRWHEDDLAGRLLDREEEEWQVIKFPAIAKSEDVLGRKPGEVLWPERYPKEEIEDIKAGMLSRMFESLYQQVPRATSENALWDYDIITHNSQFPDLDRVIVAIDPAVSSNSKSDETGIIVCGKVNKKKAAGGDKYYVIEDASGVYSPSEWAQIAVSLYNKYQASAIIGEANQGGDLIESNIRNHDPVVNYKSVKATRGKKIRAEPIAALYEQNKIIHTRPFTELEKQMTSWEQGDSDSPDRLDALVWGITELSGKSKRAGVW